MTRFSATMHADDVVHAPRQEIWDILTDPDRLAPMVPRIHAIEEIGDRWCWRMRQYNVLGVKFQPSFTERIKTQPPDRIIFTHDPGQRRENAGAEGEYRLEEVDDGTHLWIEITVTVDLPLPKFVRGAVERVMLYEMGRTGDEFATNLRRAVEG
ncbi:MAG: SRPBCC family protein [Nitriliruptorales bacterium]|nr:SRPBCC family protein [Nitriliruptorales bacterium]